MMFKILHKFVDIEFAEFFGLNNYIGTRGHAYKLNKPICNNNARQYSFACRRIDVWNSLPPTMFITQSVNSFKLQIKHVDFSKYLLIKVQTN